jgi:hypothetical protein
MLSEQPKIAVHRFFSGLTEHVFQAELGVADPPLIDYISDLVCRFVRLGALFKIRNVEGRVLHQVVDMVAEAECRIGEARREAHRHIGDFTLFWVGIYPESLHKLRSASTKDFFVDYCLQGKRAYWAASTIQTDREEDPPAEIMAQLSDEFEFCAYGLRQVRREWESEVGDDEIPRPFLIN